MKRLLGFAWLACVAGALGLGACNPSAVFIDPTGKLCSLDEPCPDGWTCGPSSDGGDTICWPSDDAGLPNSGPVLDGGGNGDAGPDGGLDGGRDGGVHDGGVGDGGHVDGGDGGAPDSGTADGGPHCTIASVTYGAGAMNPNNPCQECEPASSTTDWTNLSNGTACGGKQLCLNGSCGSGCTIDGGTVASGALNPANACQACQPATSTVTWSNLADGTACTSGGGDFCVSGNCSSACDIGGTIVTANITEPSNPCQICDPAKSSTGWSASADGPDSSCPSGQICASGSCAADCFIGGSAVAGNTFESGNACQQCLPATNPTGWTPLSDGTPCSGGGGTVCASGACAQDCDIGNTLYPSGTAEPGNPCSVCSPAQSISGWVAIADGPSSQCPAGQICASGSCASDCFIGNAVVASSALDPANPCLSCQPSSNTTGYTDVATGTACGNGLSCNGGACCNGAHGTLTCGGSAVDTCLDDDNCGACGNACGQPNGCFAGSCQLPALLPTARDSMALATGPDGRIYAIGGYLFATGLSVSTVEIFDPRTNLWTTGPSLPTPVEFIGGVADATGVFVMGGYDCETANCASGVAETFGQFLNTSTQVWSKTGNAPMSFDDTFPAIGPGGVFFMPGGYGTVSGRETLEFSPTGNGAGGSFTIGTPQLPILEGAMGVAGGLDGTIYCINGTANGTSPNAEVYTLKTGATSWSAVANDPTPRCDLAAATDANGQIYAIGGDNCSSSNVVQYANNEIFNPSAGTWSTGPALPSGAIAYITATVGPEGRIYVIGGLDFQDENYVQVYDPVNGYWIP